MALPLLEAGRRTDYLYRPILVHSALVGDSYAPVILAPGCSLAWSYAKFYFQGPGSKLNSNHGILKLTQRDLSSPPPSVNPRIFPRHNL